MILLFELPGVPFLLLDSTGSILNDICYKVISKWDLILASS